MILVRNMSHFCTIVPLLYFKIDEKEWSVKVMTPHLLHHGSSVKHKAIFVETKFIFTRPDSV